jgi:hypothetical protein
MYELFMINFGYFLDFVTDDLVAAKAKAEQVGFEVAIYRDGEVITTMKGY